MKALTILKRCRAAESEIKKLDDQIERRRDVLTSLSAPMADPNGGSRGSGDKDKTGRILAEIDALEREKAAREEAEQAEKTAALTLVDTLPDLEGKVIYDYYVRQMSTTEIARKPKEKYTEGYIRKVKRNAERLLDMISPEHVEEMLPAWYLREKGGD